MHAVAQEGTLHALSTLCADREASRRLLVDAEVVGAIVRALDDTSPQVIHALSRINIKLPQVPFLTKP